MKSRLCNLLSRATVLCGVLGACLPLDAAFASSLFTSGGGFTTTQIGNNVGGGNGGIATLVTFGGNPGVLVTENIEGFGSLPFTAGLALLFPASSYDPATSGPLTSLTMSIDYAPSPLGQLTGHPEAFAFGLLQSGNIYWAFDQNRENNTITNFTPLTLSLSATDFILLNDPNIFTLTASHPDFSSAGGTLQFGFVTFYSGQTPTTGAGNYDNFSVTTNATPLPAALPLFAGGLGGLGLLGWRRKRRVQAVA